VTSTAQTPKNRESWPNRLCQPLMPGKVAHVRPGAVLIDRRLEEGVREDGEKE